MAKKTWKGKYVEIRNSILEHLDNAFGLFELHDIEGAIKVLNRLNIVLYSFDYLVLYLEKDGSTFSCEKVFD